MLTLDAPASFDAAFDAASVRHVVAWRKGHHPSWLSGGREVSINLPWPPPREGAKGADAKRRPPWAVVAIADAHGAVAGEGGRGGDGGKGGDGGDGGEGGGGRLLAWCGTGHPSAAPGGDARFVVTDAYHKERRLFSGLVGAATVPLRLLDADARAEVELLQVATVSARVDTAAQKAWRCDPHPSWSRDGRWVARSLGPVGAVGDEAEAPPIPSPLRWIAFNAKPGGGLRQARSSRSAARASRG